MSIHYYLKLEKDIDSARQLKRDVFEALTPFYQYLNNVITSLKKKDDVKAKWSSLDFERVKLVQEDRIYSVQFSTEITLDFEKSFYSNIKHIKYKNSDINFQIKENSILLRAEIQDNQSLLINDIPLPFQVITRFDRTQLNGYKILKESEKEIIFAANIKPIFSECKEITNYPIRVDDFYLENKEKFEYISCLDESNLEFSVENAEILNNCRILTSDGIRFICKKKELSAKDRFWIQLDEWEESKTDDDPSLKSPIEYFFDDDISVEDSKRNRYEVLRKKTDEWQIQLKSESSKGKPVLPPKDSDFLKVKISTYQLQKQMDAVQEIQSKPVREHYKLLQLFQARERVIWKSFVPETIREQDWKVLTDPNRSGSDRQREFVTKALNTPDFAIMEGPPGSGKTTVILELICQAIRKNKRVLLCGSTHVAIDNVIERLKEKDLITQLGILPIRIGREGVVSDEIDEYRLEKQLDKYSGLSLEMLLDSANLVCGTTIGILQHPSFKKSKDIVSPTLPEFDYLIIDESSKTTFQEFLVPAFYAKRWVLIGDVKQLSPFTDREHIVANLENLNLKKDKVHKVIPDELQLACYYIYLILQFARSQKVYNKLMFQVDKKVYEYINNEWEKRIEKNESHPLERYSYIYLDNQYMLEDILDVCQYDIIFLEKHVVDYFLPYIPENFIFVNYPYWKSTSHYYRHKRIRKRYTYEIKDRGRNIQDSDEIYELFQRLLQDRSWAEELAWRLIRDFELRKKSKEFRFRKELEDLYPATISESKYLISIIRNIALPSILEGLQDGIKGGRSGETTISQGFSQDELKSRYTSLDYQHRMHEDISKLPKELFYENRSLLTSNMLNRDWNYSRYSERRIWIDVDGKTGDGWSKENNKRIHNSNTKEAEKMMKELESFVYWAKDQTHPEPLDKDGKWKVACLTFYRGQEKLLKEKLQEFCKQPNKKSQFSTENIGIPNVKIYLYTIDKFQGQEADIVFLSMVQTKRVGFLDSPNRLNVAITRARYQFVILGKHDFFTSKYSTEELIKLANKYK